MRFWIRRLSSGSVTSVQSSVLDLDLDLDDPECRLELEGCLEDRDDMSGLSLSVSEPEWVVSLARRLPEDFLDEDEEYVCKGFEVSG